MEALSTLISGLTTAVVFMAILTVLVIVHELGHYLFAKMFGMHINAFAVMMGGVRKTDLREHLVKPMTPAKFVWLAALALFALVLTGAFLKQDILYFVSLTGLGIGMPVWVMLRQGALYHAPVSKVLTGWIKALVIGGLVVAFGTRLQGVDVQMLIMVAIGATSIALMLNYYIPVMARDPDDDKQGQGHIEVEDDAFGTKTVDVRFRPIWYKTDKHGTEFSLLLLPLGGFAAIKGMHPKADGSEVNVEKGFYSKPAWQRWLVLFAGPLFSVVFGLIILTTLYTTIGLAVPDNVPVIGSVSEGTAADKAGLKAGDEIVAIDGVPVETFYDLTVNIRDKWTETTEGVYVGNPITVDYLRGDVPASVTFVPDVDKKPEPLRDADLNILMDDKAVQARLGVLYGRRYEPMSFVDASKEAFLSPVLMVTGLIGVALNPSTAGDNIAGPTVMVQITSSAIEQGLYYVMTLAALLSISLGVMNLLPVVPLDGGQMVVAFIEMFKGGKRLKIGVQQFLSTAGMVFIALLMLSVFAMDFGRQAKANQESSDEKPEVSSSNEEQSEPESEQETP